MQRLGAIHTRHNPIDAPGHLWRMNTHTQISKPRNLYHQGRRAINEHPTTKTRHPCGQTMQLSTEPRTADVHIGQQFGLIHETTLCQGPLWAFRATQAVQQQEILRYLRRIACLRNQRYPAKNTPTCPFRYHTTGVKATRLPHSLSLIHI